MRTISIDLKARIFALVVGYTLIGAFLLALGVSEKAAASDLSLHAQLEFLVDAIVDEDLKDIDEEIGRQSYSVVRLHRPVQISTRGGNVKEYLEGAHAQKSGCVFCRSN